MGIWDTLTGESAKQAALGASRDTYQKQIAAGEQANTGFQNVAQGYNPFIQTGLAGNNQLQNLINNPNYVSSLPGYQFAQQQGERGLFENAAARGLGQSGRAVKDFTRFNQGLASQQYGNEFNRLQGLAQFGLGATGAQAGVLGQGLSAQYNSAYGGAPTIGQGEIAGEQAKQTALSENFIKPLAYVAGAAAGGGGGSFLKGLQPQMPGRGPYPSG